VDRSEQVRGEAAVRIVTLALVRDEDPSESVLLEGVRLFGRDLPLHPEESAVGLGGLSKLPLQILAVELERDAEQLGRDPDVRQLLGIDVHGLRRHAHCERFAGAVVNRSAWRRDFKGHFLPRRRFGEILPVMNYLERDELCENGRAPYQDTCGEPCKTAV